GGLSPRSRSGHPRACGAGAAWGRSRPAWTSHLQDDQQHDGPAPETLIDEVTGGRAARGRATLPVPARGADDLLHLFEERLVFLHVHEPARGDLGTRDDRAVAVDRERNRHQTVLGEQLTVAQDDRADVTDRLAVHQHAAGREAAGRGGRGWEELA